MDHNLSLNETLGKIEPGMSVASFLAAWPAAIPFFLQRQMSCVGCSMAVFDSLEEVSRTYGLDTEEFIAELRLFLSSQPKV